MTTEDEAEMYRLCALLKAIDGTLPAQSPLREALQKGAISIQAAFIHGHRRFVEDQYNCQFLEELPSDVRERLLKLGIDPDADAV